MALTLTDEQAAVFELIESSRDHVFVTGKAGTGKSTLLEYVNWHTEKALVICAPTGVAALNVGGQTIHSLFRLPTGVIADEDIDLNDSVRKLLNALDMVVIDEVSMVNADLMDGIDRVLRQARQRDEPFGGAQLVMFGDPYQLPPIEPRDPGELAYFAAHYPSLWFFDAKVWRDVPLRVVELSQVHRQSDPHFASMLNAVRHGLVTAEIANELNTVGARRPLPSSGAITLATRNDMVRRTNERELAKLSGDAAVFEADLMGEWGRNAPADEVLELKVGAQVMFLRNDTSGGSTGPRWVNGSIGEVVELGREVVVRLGADEYEIEPSDWERYRYHFDPATKSLERELVAGFRQLPLRLAWAVTIHKSQGASFDRAIIDLGAGAFANGQTYVALSRLTSLDGLYLTRPLRPSDVRVDPTVTEFMDVVLPQ
ncbi:MAG: ATP-dependent RecD-like DNA helicase [Agromyces sp.]